MTIYEIKRLTQVTSPYFFDLKTMKVFKQTLKDFKVYKQKDGRYMITAERPYGQTIRYFNPLNNELELS